MMAEEFPLQSGPLELNDLIKLEFLEESEEQYGYPLRVFFYIKGQDTFGVLYRKYGSSSVPEINLIRFYNEGERYGLLNEAEFMKAFESFNEEVQTSILFHLDLVRKWLI